MNTYRYLLMIMSLFLSFKAQSQNDFITSKSFSYHIGSICEETSEPNPCAGIQEYLFLNFSPKEISIVQKEISTCGSEEIIHQFSYEWKLINDSSIKIESNPQEIQYSYFKDLDLRIENKKIIGYKQLSKDVTQRIVFNELNK